MESKKTQLRDEFMPLATEEDMVPYLNTAFEHDDLGAMTASLGDLARAT